jgi:peroxiredoxin
LFNVTEKYQIKINNKFDKDIAEYNGSDEAQLPVPATFVIDTNGKIVYKQFDYNYRKRASATDIYNAVLKAKQ